MKGDFLYVFLPGNESTFQTSHHGIDSILIYIHPDLCSYRDSCRHSLALRFRVKSESVSKTWSKSPFNYLHTSLPLSQNK